MCSNSTAICICALSWPDTLLMPTQRSFSFSSLRSVLRRTCLLSQCESWVRNSQARARTSRPFGGWYGFERWMTCTFWFSHTSPGLSTALLRRMAPAVVQCALWQYSKAQLAFHCACEDLDSVVVPYVREAARILRQTAECNRSVLLRHPSGIVGNA